MNKNNRKTNLKKLIGRLHLWLGLVSGLIVFTVAFTGTLFVFCDETIDIFAGDAKYVTTKNTYSDKLSSDVLITKFKEQVKDRTPFYIDSYQDKNRSFRIASMDKDKKAFAYTYMNPYTGEILKTTQVYWFFYIVAHIHAELLLHGLGKTLVGISTIIFFIQLLSGLILWWPKKWTKSTKANAFTIKKGTKWRRKNYDYHNVFGFYALFPALLITVTGLIMSYEILMSLTQKTFGGSEEGIKLLKKYEPKYDATKNAVPFQFIIDKNFQENPSAKQMRISFYAKDSATTYYTQVGEYIGLKSRINGKSFFTDKYTGEKIKLPLKLEKHLNIEETNFDLHTGYWGGLLGKILTFLVGLICTSLPITGFLIWYGRKYKKLKQV
ncbi:PepSY-associated TM helix domain-containing protein [Riemerella anatipestifer]|nr:PepSY-associated TM helix domain-containing protein [Riemerella anatipestifer]